MAIVNVDLGESFVLPPAKTPKEMLSVTKTEDGRTKVRINASSLSIIQECLRKSRYSLAEGWRAKDESPATVFGSAFHAALEVFYTGKYEDRYVPDLELLESMSYGHRVPGEDSDFILRAARAFVDKAQLLAALPETDKRSIQNGVWILQHYMKTFREDPYVALVDERGPFVERTFSLPFHEDEKIIIELFGTIDFVLKNINTGQLIPGDHKTTGSISFNESSYFDRERPCHQYSIYSLAARDVFGIESNAFMVSIVEVKARPKTSRGSPPSFPRQITSRGQEDYDELHESVLKAVRDYLEAKESGVWPLGPVSACAQYGACTYKAVCAAPKMLRENILSSKYDRKIP